jgi:predicted secreted protein
MTDAISGYGTLFQVGDAATPEVFTTIAEIKSISGPSLSLDTADATNMASTGGWREVIPTILNGGDITLEVNYDPADATLGAGSGGLIDDMENKTLRNFKLVMSDSGTTTWTFAGYVTAFSPDFSFDDVVTASITVTISGQPTLA